MIIKFKIFESSDKTEYKYWIVKNDIFYHARLYKLGIPFNVLENFNISGIYKVVYVGLHYDINDKNVWSYSFGDKVFRNENYEFMGKVELTKDDILAYDSIKNGMKYNL